MTVRVSDSGTPPLSSTTTFTITVTSGNYVESTSNPVSQVVSAGNPVSFVSAATGTPTPTVQWQVSTDAGNTFSDIAGAASATLTFTTTATQNGNEYRAVFTNSSSTATTAPATLTVNSQPGGLVISAADGVFPQFSLAQPPDGGQTHFGADIVALSNGNFVVTALSPPSAYLYNGQTGALISTLIGTGALGFSVTVLTNGNYVLSGWSQGTATATWASGTTGISGTVSPANSLVAGGGVSSNGFKVIPLASGNYVVDFIGWNGNTGAVTWGNGATGTVGTVSSTNSLVGTNFGDFVGGNGGNGEIPVTALSNGNYVVESWAWNNDEGAVTWGDGATGVTGTISAENSLIGWADPHSELTVTPLANGNYVVSDSQWKNGTGVFTWGSGTSGVDGVVSATNSLVGTTNDELGYSVVPLANGNFVASGIGIATWGSGAHATSGTVSAQNSLMGDGNRIAEATALANGNYVIDFPVSPAPSDGVVTWGNGTTGTTGTVSPQNSLVGNSSNDIVGISNDSGGVTALTNGNYVVSSPNWDGESGAVTWGNGASGTVGTVSVVNSLVGTIRTGGFHDQVGSGGVTALPNGNYIVDSPQWFTSSGAVTWGNGASERLAPFRLPIAWLAISQVTSWVTAGLRHFPTAITSCRALLE